MSTKHVNCIIACDLAPDEFGKSYVQYAQYVRYSIYSIYNMYSMPNMYKMYKMISRCMASHVFSPNKSTAMSVRCIIET